MKCLLIKGKVVKAAVKKSDSEIKNKLFDDTSSSKKVTAFYDFFEMEPKLTKLQNNIQYFLDTVNKTLKKLDSIKALYQTESDLDGNKAEFLITVTNKEMEEKTFSISLEGNFVRTRVLLREKVNNEYKQLRYPLFTEIDKFLGEL